MKDLQDTKLDISVLFVDDEIFVREKISNMLGREVRDLYLAENGQEGLELFKSRRPDVIITDIKMPVMDGLEMARAIRAVDSSVPIIVTTVHEEVGFLMSAIDIGIESYMLKPLVMSRLGNKLKAISAAIHITEELRQKNRLVEETLLKYKSLVNAVGEITFEHFVPDNNIVWSNTVGEILGYSKEEMGHDIKSWEDKVHPDDLAGANAAFERAARGNRLYDMAYRFRHKDGHYLWFNDRGSMHLDSEGTPSYVIGVMKNITEQKTADETMKTLLTAVEQSSDWILIADRSGKIEYVNEAVERVTGYKKEEILGKTPRILKSGRHDKAFYQKMWDTILSGQTYTTILTNRKKNGELFEVYHTITPIKDEHDSITNFVASSKDITAVRQMEERINFLAYYDDLTGLPNRALFTDRLRQALARSVYHDKCVGALFIDVDRFHMINDTRGANFGDVLLKEIGKRLSTAVREGDTVARFGSDEFAVVLNDVSRSEDIIYILEEIQKVLSEPIRTDGEETMLTFSVGISVYPNDTADITTLIQNADMACQQIKQRGGNNYRFFTAAMNATASEFIRVEKHLKKALKNDEFVLHYQPYWDIHTQKMVGMEALIRWQSADQGLVPPSKFIPVLEETGMIIEVGDWVMKTAIQQADSWQKKGFPVVPVSVNLSLVQFRQSNLVEKIWKLLETSGLDPALLIAEITESSFMEDLEFTKATLTELRNIGISISIDDFGTGYSSLSYLKRLPVDNLKIDISFIRELGKDPDAEAIVSAIITMANAMNMKTIAEGVETEEQWRILRLLRCDITQGFYFSRPLPAEGIEELFAGALSR